MNKANFFISLLCLLCLNFSLYAQTGVKPQSVSKPVVRLNGKKINDEAMASGKDVISVTCAPGESIVLSFSYLVNVRKSAKDLRDGELTPQQAANVNVGAFTSAPMGTMWVLSFYATRNGERGETEIVILTRGA